MHTMCQLSWADGLGSKVSSESTICSLLFRFHMSHQPVSTLSETGKCLTLPSREATNPSKMWQCIMCYKHTPIKAKWNLQKVSLKMPAQQLSEYCFHSTFHWINNAAEKFQLWSNLHIYLMRTVVLDMSILTWNLKEMRTQSLLSKLKTLRSSDKNQISQEKICPMWIKFMNIHVLQRQKVYWEQW